MTTTVEDRKRKLIFHHFKCLTCYHHDILRDTVGIALKIKIWQMFLIFLLS